MKIVLTLIVVAMSFGLISTPALAQENAVTAVITDPNPARRFTITDQPVVVSGTVEFDPDLMQYWKVEIKGNNRRSYIGEDPLARTWAYNWVTLDSTRTDSVNNGPLAVIPTWPTLSEGNWQLRLVVVGHNDEFLSEQVAEFRVRIPETDPVYVNITHPAATGVLSDNSVRGTLILNQFVSAYRVDLLGGPYLRWTTVAGPFRNNTGNPTQIHDDVIASISTLESLPPGQYELRLVVLGLDGQHIQEPTQLRFNLGSGGASNLPAISITRPRVRSGGIDIEGSTPLIGSVTLPEGAAYYKVEIKDNFDPEDNEDNQPVQFPEWTTINTTHSESVSNGVIETIPALVPGEYLLRIVIVAPDGEFVGDPYEIELTVEAD